MRGDVLTVAEVLALVRPAFRGMLHDDEYRSLRLVVVPTEASGGPALNEDDLVEHGSAVLRWRIMQERGWSGWLDVDGGPEALVRGVQSDLQDFIAESRFGWGEFREYATEG